MRGETLYTRSAEHPLVTLGLLALASGAIAGLILGKRELSERRSVGGRLSRAARDLRERMGV